MKRNSKKQQIAMLTQMVNQLTETIEMQSQRLNKLTASKPERPYAQILQSFVKRDHPLTANEALVIA